MAATLICRICGGHANPETSLNLFSSNQTKLLKYIKKTLNITIKLLENLPTHICRNCQDEIKFPQHFLTRYANAQYFFMTDDYKEKLVLMERFCKQDGQLAAAHSFRNQNIETPTNEIEHIDNSKDNSSSDSDSESFKLDPEINILTLSDILKPRKKVAGRRQQPQRVVYKCHICENLFSERGNFIVHLNRHTGIKPFECKLCPKKYVTTGELKAHISSHTGEKPFVCQYCNRRFSSNGEKNRHERKHTGEKRSVCEFCGKKYARACDFRKHRMTHTLQKPYACTRCDETFWGPKQLQLHYHLHAPKL